MPSMKFEMIRRSLHHTADGCRGFRNCRQRPRARTLCVENLEHRTLLSGSPPVVLLAGAGEAVEGTTYSVTLHVADQENDPVSGWTIDWGDGRVENIAGNPSQVSHVYTTGPASRTV